VKTTDIAALMDVQPITWYITKRFAKWIGHVARMSDERLPKRLMFAWPRTDTTTTHATNRGKKYYCFSLEAHRTIVTMKHCLQQQPKHSTLAERFHTVIGKEDERFDCEREKIYGSTEWKQRLKRRALRQRITWRTGTSFAEGCLNWSPYASWMDVAQDRDAWRIATSTLLQNTEY
jgi:hypothetical protein